MKGLRKDWGPCPYNESKQHFQQFRFKAPFPFLFYIYWYVILHKNGRRGGSGIDTYRLFLLVNCLPLRRSCCLQCGTLRDMVSVTVWRLHGRSNACECMLPFFSSFMSFLSVCMAFEWVYQLSNACMPFKRVNISNLMRFDFFFFFFTRNQNILPG